MSGYSSAQKGRTGAVRLDGTLMAMQQTKGAFGTTAHNQSPGQSIMRRSGSGGLRREASGDISNYKGMEPINEQHENFQEQMTQHSNFEESIRDPTKSRELSYISGLTEFLKEEFYKRIGYHSENEADLLNFWKNYVSEMFRDQRLAAIRKRKDNPSYNEFSDFDMDYNIGLGLGQNDTMDSYTVKEERVGFRSSKSPKEPRYGPFYPAPNKSYKPPQYRQRSRSAKKLQSLTHQSMRRPSGTYVGWGKAKADPEKYLGLIPSTQVKESIEDAYRRYSQCLLYDVTLTINNDIQEQQKQAKVEQLKYESQMLNSREEKIRKTHQSKMSTMLKAYYQYKINMALKPLWDKYVLLGKQKHELQSKPSVSALRDKNPLATGEKSNVKGNLVSKDAGKEAQLKEKERQKEIQRKRKQELKEAKAKAKAEKKAQLKKRLGEGYESITSDEDESDEEEDSDDDEFEASQSVSKKAGSRLEESVGKASHSRSRDDLAQTSVSMKSKKMGKWIEPDMPTELQLCDKIDRNERERVSRTYDLERECMKKIMFMVREIVWDKAKPYNQNVERLTNNEQAVTKIYLENHRAYFADGAMSNAQQLIKKFFSDKELGIRFVIYRDYINKSRRRGDVPLSTLFDNIRYEDRVLNFIDQDKEPIPPKPKEYDEDGNEIKTFKDANGQILKFTKKTNKTFAAQKPKGSEIVNPNGKWHKQVPYLVKLHDEIELRECQEQKRQEEMMKLKRAKDEDALQRKVFGQKWNSKKQDYNFGYDTDTDKSKINRPDYTKPKNKWKVASTLHELKKDFAHDRVIERMYKAEIADNQPFKAPQEYDLFDKEVEKKLKENFGGKASAPVHGKKPLLWKEPNFNDDEVKMENFMGKDNLAWDQEIEAEKKEYKEQEKLERHIQKQAAAYHQLVKDRNEAKAKGVASSALVAKVKKDANGQPVLDKEGKPVMVMEKIQTKETFVTLRATLANNYWEMINKFGARAYARFPHNHRLMGQDPKKSKTFMNSYPASYKNYFFKLVKNIIKSGKNIKFQRQPASLVNCVGARSATLADPIGTQTHNTRLKPFKVGAGLKKYRTKAKDVFPQGWRTRALKRKDNAKIAEKLKDVFMMQSEIENCTFAPDIARQDGETFYKNSGLYEGYNEPEKPGEFFNRFGPNFINGKDTKSLYKNGKLKKARIQFLQGQYDKSLSTLQDAFNLVKLFAHYRPKEYKAWDDYKKMLKNPPQSKKKKTPPKSGYGYSSSGQKRSTSPYGYKVADKWELDQDQVNKVVSVFQKYEKSNKTLKFEDLSVCMRELGMVPKEVVLDEFTAEVRQRTGKQFCDFKTYSDFMAKYMVDEMTDRDLKEAFDLLDENGNGTVDAAEFSQIMNSIETEFNAKDIEEMVKMADKNGDGEIDFKEFKAVMKAKKGKDPTEKQKILRDMKDELSRYLKIRSVTQKYQKLSRHFKEALEKQADKMEEIRQNDKSRAEGILIEEFDQAKLQGMYDGAWALYEEILKREHEVERTKRRQEKSMKDLQKQKRIVIGGEEQDLEAKSGEEDSVVDYKKLYKTIMCPLRKECPKVKMLRWPSTNLKSRRPFGKDCPYAHHPMELLFPETLDIRISANKTIQKKDAAGAKGEWKFSGALFDCTGCGTRCSLCLYKTEAKKMMDKYSLPIKTKHVKTDKVLDRQEEVNKRDGLFAKKFGILKKASVLLFYDRPNDAFETISKAAQIMKDQYAENQQKELDLQKYWQDKLRLPAVELPDGVSYDKVLPEDITDEFLGRMTDGAGGDRAALKLYLQRVCPKVRSQYDKNTFLDGLIEDLYLNCWDKLNSKMKGIEGIHKKVEEYGNIWEQMEAYGSDQDQDQMDFVDNEGNPIKLKRQKKQMCENVQKKKKYKDENIETIETKYYVDTKFQRQNVQDPKTGTVKQIVCSNGKDCKFAHNAIELDLNQLPQKIKNLNNVIKVQDRDLKADRLLDPWRPSAASFKVSDLQDYIKPKKKKEGEEDDDKKPKREGILARENPFRKPYEKD